MRRYITSRRARGIVLSVGLCLGIGLNLPTCAAAGLEGPKASDRPVALVVASLLQREHLSRHPVDDEISRRGMELFLKSLDPMKVYFYQADVDEFSERKNDLDDLLKRGDIKFAYRVFQRFLERVDERIGTVKQLLEAQHDFTLKEELVSDAKEATFPKSEKEAVDRWRKRVKYDLLMQKADKLEGEAARTKIRRRYESFSKRMHQTDSDELLEMYLSAITNAFDPHTTFMSPTSLDNFDIIMKLELEGIGAALQVNDGYTEVSKVIPGGAADKHGKLKTGDRIVSVGQGEAGDMVDVVDMKLNDVVKLIRGNKGTTVRLGVMPAVGGETQVYAIRRDKIELKDSEARGEIIDEGKKANGSAYRFGVIDLPSFYMDMTGARNAVAEYKSTTRDVRRLLEDFKKKNVDVVVLDLRRNGGGSLTEAINLTGLFVDSGPVVQVKDAEGTVQKYDDLEKGMTWDGPLVVLTSKFSASASEILAGAIQDYGRGIIVGDDATHGKGTVQSLLNLGGQLFRVPNPPNYGALKITMQQFYRPNGDSTQKRGVLADLALPSVTTYMDVGESDLDYPVEFDRVPAARFTRYGMVTPEILSKLRDRSVERRTKSAEFDKLLQNIERYRTQKAKKRVTLNEAEFFAQRGELDAEKEEEEQFKQQQNSTDEVVKKDFYFKEVVQIALDYVRLLEHNKIARAH